MNTFRHQLHTLAIAVLTALGALLPNVAQASDVLPELANHYIQLNMTPATEIVKDKWYVMYNVGRKGFLCDDESKLHISTAPPAPDAMKYLVRITETKGYQVVQTGLGRYFKYLSTSNNSGTATAASASNVYTYGTIEEGYFWLKDKNGMVLDANALGSAIDATSTVAGWGKDTPTSVTGNNSWRFFPVELIDASDDFAEVPYAFGTFSFQSAENFNYLYFDSNNLGLTEEEEKGTVLLGVDGAWTLGVPEGSGQKSNFHIGTGGKFSAGPASPIKLYRVTETDDLGYTYKEANHIIDGAAYLIVGNLDGTDYALYDVIDSQGTSNQRMLSSKVKFNDDGTATFTGANASNPLGHQWLFHYGESLITTPFVYHTGETGGASGSGEPLLTIACVSDIHTQEGWLTTTTWDDKDNGYYKPRAIKDIRVRESLGEAVKLLKDEHVDVLIVGGDCQSDATVDEEHWRQVRQLMAEALRTVGPSSSADGKDFSLPVLYVNGNHEYEVASTWGGNGNGYYNWRHTRPFNAGEYYEFPMRSDVGVLASDYDCFYEDAPNDAAASTKKTMPVLAAYHYNIKGFDFVVLNCGKHLFHNANNYSYSEESVAWVARKLQQIYADDPSHTKPVFFALHIPFGDSNSMNVGEDKGMSYYESTHQLKQVLAQYPGLVMLYGHDHGADYAYIRQKTSQRVTRYDTQGNVMATSDGETTFDKDVETGEPMKVTEYKGQSVIFHPYSGKTTASLGVKGTFTASSASVNRTTALLDYTNTCTIYPEVDGAISMRLGDGSQHLNFNNGFGISAAAHQQLFLYHVIPNGDTFTVERVQQAVDGELYLIGSAANIFKVGGTRSFMPADSYSTTTFSTYFWRAELPAAAEPSFVSSFMGSCRYYANSNGEPANSSYGNRKLIQGLLIYVYPDRIVFNMKNFRNNVGTRVRHELAPYVVKRQTAAPEAEAVVQHNASGAYYRRVTDATQLCDRSVCIFVDEDRQRSFGIADNNTGKFATIPAAITADGLMMASGNANECEFVLEKKPEGARALAPQSNTWYLRTQAGYIKSDGSRLYHRQQSLNYYSTNPLANEVLNASVTPWQITIDENGHVAVENEQIGLLNKQTVGMTTSTLTLYQKVVAADIDAATGLGTYYSEQALCMPEGTEAYTVNGLNSDGSLHFVRQTTKVPAKTGLVLRQKTAAANGSIEIPVIDDRYAPVLMNNLQGTLADVLTTAPMVAATETAAANDYSFYRFEADRFAPVDASASAFINANGNAYLALPSDLASAFETAPASAISALLDAAEVNGIADIIASPIDASAPIYNLAGQRVAVPSALPSGIYIVGGKKMIVK
ncbi:MAG: metallophosphoesterase [Bacteroidales bacterium]|nr:metallophosphoesterase [Bacteroidales bacterium]